MPNPTIKPTPLIYVAAPYTTDNPFLLQLRVIQINEYAASLFTQGFHVFSPISHCHPIKECSLLEGTWDFWKKYNRRMLSLCDTVHVLKLHNWEQSKGVKGEIEYALGTHKPVLFFCPMTKSLTKHP